MIFLIIENKLEKKLFSAFGITTQLYILCHIIFKSFFMKNGKSKIWSKYSKNNIIKVYFYMTSSVTFFSFSLFEKKLLRFCGHWQGRFVPSLFLMKWKKNLRLFCISSFCCSEFSSLLIRDKFCDYFTNAT